MFDSETDAEPGQIRPVTGRVRPQFGRAQDRQVLVNDPEAPRQRLLGAATVSVCDSQQSAGIPRLGSHVRGASTSRRHGLRQVGSGRPGPTGRQGQLSGKNAHVGAFHGPSLTLQRGRHPLGSGHQSGWRPDAVSQLQDLGLDGHVLGQGRPRRSSGGTELVGDGECQVASIAVLTARQQGPGQEKAALGQIGQVIRSGHDAHGGLGRGLGFADQSRQQQHLAAVSLEHGGEGLGSPRRRVGLLGPAEGA